MASYPGRVDGATGSITVGPQALDAAGRSLAYVDMDTVTVAGYTIDLGMHPAGTVRIQALGPRTDAFLADLDEARSRARRAALLQWTGTPELASFTQAPAGPADVPVAVRVFDDGLTVEPRNGTPELMPYALIDTVDRDGYSVTMSRRGLDPVTVRRLGPRTDQFLATLERGRAGQRQAMADAYGTLDDRLLGYAAPNGWAQTADEAGVFGGALAEAFAAAERAEEMAVLSELTGRAGGGLRYGLALQPEGPMPFVLATGETHTAMESVAGDQARASYVFATTDTDALNRALIMISFRREALYLAEASLGRWSLAVRTLPVVQWARSVYAARIVHDGAWPEAIAAALR
jgi:hypothetical protein